MALLDQITGSLSSFTGFLAARFILPEVYGYIEQEKEEIASVV